MKRIYYSFIIAVVAMLLSTTAFSQDPCITWLEPSATTGWTDFNTTFGGAPCDDGTGCPLNEITAFQVWASEAYTVNDFVASGTYSFSMCNGAGAGSWIPEFTIIAPSGAVDASGTGDGDGCTITWTASESGTYFIVINEVDACGGGTNTGTDNGFPALTCVSSDAVNCAPVVDICFAGTLTTTGMVTVCPADTFGLNLINDTIPTGGGLGYVFDPLLGGTGGLEGQFILTGVNNTASYDNDLNGILSSNNFPVMSGTWVIKSAVYTDPNNTFGSICDLSADSLIVTFSDFALVVNNDGGGDATANASGGTMPYTFLWADGQTTQTATGLEEGIITVTVTEDGGCSIIDSVMVSLAIAPCTTWLEEYTVFNDEFGGAPCDDGTGCPFNEVADFNVWASEAYFADDFAAGGTYAFSICNGDDAGAWIPEFTIIAPSGAIDAFGAGDGDSCTITWTASESGTYTIVINEAGACGGGTNTDVNNGFIALTCVSSMETQCAAVDTTCIAGTLTTTGMVTACDTFSFDLTVENDSIADGGGFGYTFDPLLGGTGGLDGAFILTNAPQITSYNNDLNGILSNNNFPVMAGTWVIKGAVYSDAADAFASICQLTGDSLIVTFGESPMIESLTDNADGTATVTASGGGEPYSYLWSDGQTTQTAVSLLPGPITVTVTETDGCSTAAELDIMVGLYDIDELETLRIFPNPTSDKLFVEIGLNNQETVNLQLFDVTGKKVHQLVAEQTSIDNYMFDLADYPKGIYMLRIQIGENSISRRIVVE